MAHTLQDALAQAIVDTEHYSNPTSRARAILAKVAIARAVNAHEALVSCLLAYVELEEQAAPASSSPMRERARAALAEARGE